MTIQDQIITGLLALLFGAVGFIAREVVRLLKNIIERLVRLEKDFAVLLEWRRALSARLGIDPPARPEQD